MSSTIFAGTTLTIALPLTVVATGAPVNAASFTVTVSRPAPHAASATYTYPSAEVTRDGTGGYALTYTPAAGVAAMYSVVPCAVVGAATIYTRTQFQVTAP